MSKKHHAEPVRGDINLVDNKLYVDHGVLRFHGLVGQESKAKTGGGTYYPGGAEVFVATLIGHAVGQKLADNTLESRAQKVADGVLVSYSDIIDKMVVEQLTNRWIEDSTLHVHDGDELPSGGYLISINPVFFMVQNADALVLKNLISITDAQSTVVYRNMIEVVSEPFDSDAADYWKSQAEGVPQTNFELVAQHLFDESMYLVLEDAQNNLVSTSQLQTFRYALGEQTKYERAALLVANGSRQTVQTLRGWIKSFTVAE